MARAIRQPKTGRSLSYTSNSPVTLSGIGIVGANAGEYSVIPSEVLPKTIAAGATFDVLAAFTPTMMGTRSAIVQLQVTGAYASVDTALSGTASRLPSATASSTFTNMPGLRSPRGLGTSTRTCPVRVSA